MSGKIEPDSDDSGPGELSSYRSGGPSERRLRVCHRVGGEINVTTGVIDPAGGYAYIAAGTTPATIIKIHLSDLSRSAMLVLNPGENNLVCAAIDPTAGFAYFGANTPGLPGTVIKVRLSDLTRMGAVSFHTGENGATSAAIDTTHGYAYFGTYTSPGNIVRLDLGNFHSINIFISLVRK